MKQGLQTHPRIEHVIPTEEPTGYVSRTLCLADGWPCEIEVRVNTRRPEYSEFDMRIYRDGQWQHVHRMTFEEVKFAVGHLGVLHDSDDTRAQVQTIASGLHLVGEAILVKSRERAADIAAQSAIYVDQVLTEDKRQRRTARLDDIAAQRRTRQARASAAEETDPFDVVEVPGDVHADPEMAAQG